MAELTVAQAYAFDKRLGWLWFLGASRPVRSRAGVRFAQPFWSVKSVKPAKVAPGFS
ncbi:MAG TPA: hypothetical protein VNN99_14425 [Vicinamibacterales bacterium]|nr:hypothetical protein [Vicinamibacterales bacterium]